MVLRDPARRPSAGLTIRLLLRLHVRRLVKPANDAPYTYDALSNPAGLGGLLGLSRAGALAMCAKCRRAGAGVRTPPGWARA